MIERIKIYPVREILKWVNKGIQPFFSWNLISITNNLETALIDKEKMRLKFLGCNDILALQFADVSETESKDEDILDTIINIHNSRIFNKEDAEKIVSFVETLHRKENKETLVVHCMAGISRSGAVGMFINDLLRLNHSTFQRDNPGIRPNPFILSILREVSNFWGYQ